MNEKEILEFKNGIFSLHTRRFGTLAEIMIKKIFKLDFSKKISCDLVDKDRNIEVKFSTVLKENDNRINENNVIEQIKLANHFNRSIKQNELNKVRFDSNIQQIKTKLFDILYYGLFFADVIEIFKIDSNDIKNVPKYSDFQHEGNIGEGQFHLNNDTYKWHKEHCFVKSITYGELYILLGE